MAGTTRIQPGNRSFSPQYSLWSDGATKRRWIYLPPGSAIDASDPDAWNFPVGTRLWKEFSYSRPIETRYIERLPSGSWLFAAYVWNDDGSDAILAPEAGLPGHVANEAPGGRYPIPSREDCLACHEGAAVPVLGFSALQLSPDRDGQAVRAETPHPADLLLTSLVSQGLIVNLPDELLARPPRITAPSPAARSALGHLHANCGHCHNNGGPLTLLDLVLAQSVAGGVTSADDMLQTLVGQRSDFDLPGASQRIVPGLPSHSVLALRMRARDPLTQMPPLGTQIPDSEGIALVERWIREQL
ncbi:MAG TPA: hypothetical protein PKK10_10285 [Woeseiaceae bacterium]|nr:hypothetical protein [Woeseiaceae bacterium]